MANYTERDNNLTPVLKKYRITQTELARHCYEVDDSRTVKQWRWHVASYCCGDNKRGIRVPDEGNADVIIKALGLLGVPLKERRDWALFPSMQRKPKAKRSKS